MNQIFISIGNSDNKLTQSRWSEFVQHIGKIIEDHATQTHFFGGSVTWAAWQNVAWLIDCTDYMAPSLKSALTECRQKYDQDSVAWLYGETKFI